MSSLKEMQNSAMEAAAKHPPDAVESPPSMPQRRVERNNSGPAGNKIMVSRRPPQRSKSNKIGRPAFSKELPPEPTRGVNRNKSGRLRSAPNRDRSFGRAAPDRSGSTGSLKGHRKQQQLAGGPAGFEIGDDVSVTDSVFTSASNQTLDSIMLRKKQFGPSDAKPEGMRMPSRSIESSTGSFDFDDTLHTVDSIHVHHRHVAAEYDDDDDQGDLSVFSESFASTDTYELSEYDEEEGANVRETGLEESEFEVDGEEEEKTETKAEEKTETKAETKAEKEEDDNEAMKE